MAIQVVPLYSRDFLGGGFSTYSANPLFWGNVNFDGEHYLTIAQIGYQPLTYFYFPVFPLLTKFLSFGRDLYSLAWSGLLIANVAFLVALVGIYKLVMIDMRRKTAKWTVILLLIFPTSFYFGTFYTESVFLALVVWSFYFARRGNFLVASILAAFLSATKVIGVLMFPILMVEYFLQNRKRLTFNYWSFGAIFISPLGILVYLYYLWKQTGDPLNFLSNVAIFGQQRSSSLVILPQVFYRYIFKILPQLTYSYFPVVFTTYLELWCALIFLIVIIYGFFRLRMSYALYALFGYIVPTLAGSFSSLPRYVLVIFPVFMLMAIMMSRIRMLYRWVFLSGMIILLVIAQGLFWRGYWVS